MKTDLGSSLISRLSSYLVAYGFPFPVTLFVLGGLTLTLSMTMRKYAVTDGREYDSYR
jgi:hypothetical protein